MRTRAERRHQTHRHMWRRLKEDRNQHYDNLACPCYTNPKTIAQFKEQPKLCSLSCCGNPRRWFGEVTVQERRFLESAVVEP